MHISPLQPISTSSACVSGDVTIDPSAAIALGVLIQADPNSKIIIAAGVCIGMGSIIHAQGGELEIAAGANLGAGVLILGQGKIGENSCIGSLTTILNSSVVTGQVVAPGSLIDGISDRQTDPHIQGNAIANSINSANSEVEVFPSPEKVISTSTTQVIAEVITEVKSSEVKPSESSSQSTATTHGQVQLNRLMGKLFPHRQSVDLPSNHPSSQA
jgi:carbon dioxide concentrating mechanism protein CcmN